MNDLEIKIANSAIMKSNIDLEYFCNSDINGEVN